MSRIVNRPITVQMNNSTPSDFTDGDDRYVITHVIDRWSEAGAWWQNEPQRTVYRVQTRDEYVFDIERAGEAWFIYRVWD